MAVNLAEKYSAKVDEAFQLASVTTSAVNQEYDWDGVNTVHVYGAETVDLNNYTMSGTSRYGTPTELGNTKQTLVLSQDKAFTFTIDRRNYNSTMMTQEAGKALRRQIDQVVVPAIDKYRLSIMAENATEGNTGWGALTKTTAYEKFLAGTEQLGNKKTPSTGRICYCTYAFYGLIKQDASFIKSGDLSQDMLIKGQVGAVDGTAIIPVPIDYLPENTSFLMTHSIATTAPIKLEEYKMHDNPPGINGWLVEGRIVYDAFVLNNKRDAIYVHYGITKPTD